MKCYILVVLCLALLSQVNAQVCNYTSKNTAFVPGLSTVADLNADSALDIRFAFTADLGANSTTFSFVGNSIRCNSNATAPTAGTWTVNSTVATCTRNVFFQIDLNQALQFCNFDRIEGLRNAATTTYRADILITTRALMKRIRGVDMYSTMESSVAIDIDFLNNITTTSGNLSVYGVSLDSVASNVYARVISQVYDPVTGTATLNILTSVNWPLQLSLMSFTASNAAWPVSVAYANPTGPGTSGTSNFTGRCDDGTLGVVNGISGTDGTYNAGNPCAQFWTVVVRRSLTGCPTATTLARSNWTFNFTFGCHSLFTGICSFSPSDASSYLNIAFDTNSDNLCPVLLDTESVTATVAASGSAFGGAVTADYVFGARTFLQVNVVSPIRLERTIIERVTIVSGAPTANMVIYTNLLSAAAGANGVAANHRTCQMPASCTQGVFNVMSPASNLSPTLIDVQDTPSGNVNVSRVSWIWSSFTSAATGDNPTAVIVRVEVRVRFFNQSTVSDRRIVLNTPVKLLNFDGAVSAAETAFTITGAVDNGNNGAGNGDTTTVASATGSGVSTSMAVMGIVGAVVGVVGIIAAAALMIKSRKEQAFKNKQSAAISTSSSAMNLSA